MTTSSSATTPLVVHSFTPSTRYAVPSSVSVAVLSIRAGSDPTSGSVRRKAEIAPAAQRGRKRSFWSSVPTSLTGSGTPIDWWAESRAPRDGCTDPTRISARAYQRMVRPSPPYSRGDLHAEGPHLGEGGDVLVRDEGVTLDPGTVHVRADRPEAGEEGLPAGLVVGVGPWVWVHEVEVEPSQVELLGEARIAPAALACLLGDVSGLLLGDLRPGTRSGPGRGRSGGLRVGAHRGSLAVGLPVSPLEWPDG